MADPKVVEQPEIAMEPASTPPSPAEARTFLSTHEMSAYLLLQPVLDETEAASGIANSKVVHPAADDRIDQLDYSAYRLGIEASEDVFELAQQYRSLLELGRIIRPPPLALQATMLVQRPWERQRLAKKPDPRPDPPWGFWEKDPNFLENFGGGGGN